MVWVGCKSSIVDDFRCLLDGLDNRVRNENLWQQLLCEARVTVFVRLFEAPGGEFVSFDGVLFVSSDVCIAEEFLVRNQFVV